MTNELVQLLNKAKDELNKNPKGQLVLPLRKEIYRLMGERIEDNEGHAIKTEGYFRRLKLAVLCVNHVLSIWENVMPNDNTPAIF